MTDFDGRWDWTSAALLLQLARRHLVRSGIGLALNPAGRPGAAAEKKKRTQAAAKPKVVDLDRRRSRTCRARGNYVIRNACR